MDLHPSLKPTDTIRWRGRLGVFVHKSKKKHMAYIRLAGLKSHYLVSIHEIRREKILPKAKLPIIKDDPLAVLISK
jgi:hypothetical protein